MIDIISFIFYSWQFVFGHWLQLALHISQPQSCCAQKGLGTAVFLARFKFQIVMQTNGVAPYPVHKFVNVIALS